MLRVDIQSVGFYLYVLHLSSTTTEEIMSIGNPFVMSDVTRHDHFLY